MHLETSYVYHILIINYPLINKVLPLHFKAYLDNLFSCRYIFIGFC